MANHPDIKLDARFKKRIQGRYERFVFQAGVLQNKAHKDPKPAKPLASVPKSKPVPKPVKKQPTKKKSVKPTIKSKVAKAKKKIKRALTPSFVSKKKKHADMVKAHRMRGLGTMDGGPVRLKKATTHGTVAEIAEIVRVVHGIPYLTAPFQNPNTPEMKSLRRAMFNLLIGKNRNYSKVETALRHVLRVPFLKKRYGSNSPAWRKVKTFDRLGIDTGQFYQALQGKVRVNPNVQK